MIVVEFNISPLFLNFYYYTSKVSYVPFSFSLPPTFRCALELASGLNSLFRFVYLISFGFIYFLIQSTVFTFLRLESKVAAAVIGSRCSISTDELKRVDEYARKQPSFVVKITPCQLEPQFHGLSDYFQCWFVIYITFLQTDSYHSQQITESDHTVKQNFCLSCYGTTAKIRKGEGKGKGEGGEGLHSSSHSTAN